MLVHNLQEMVPSYSVYEVNTFIFFCKNQNWAQKKRVVFVLNLLARNAYLYLLGFVHKKKAATGFKYLPVLLEYMG